MTTDLNHQISWYALERHLLGHYSAARDAEVVDSCCQNPTTMRRIETIRADQRPMPRFNPPVNPPFLLASLRRPLLGLAVAVFLAVGVGIGFRFAHMPAIDDAIRPPGVKGGDITVYLVRERNGAISHSPGSFMTGDRFRVYVSSPYVSEASMPAEVTVFQGNEVLFPYKKRLRIEAGNHRELPKSLSFSGKLTARICVTVDKHIPQRQVIQRKGQSALPENTACIDLLALPVNQRNR